MDGLLPVDKPKGISSHDVVDKVRQVLRIKKVGHAGTLDPAATGLLLICVGRATKLTLFLQNLDKTYQGEMIFGVTTSSLDEEGEVVEEKNASSLSKEKVEELFSRFRGEIIQTPPMFSAVHYQGKRLYELARKKQIVERAPRRVQIYELKLLRFTPLEGPNRKVLQGLKFSSNLLTGLTLNSHPQAEFRVRCSKGTYIRSLCADIGKASDFGAYQASLRRISIGPFNLKQAKKFEELDKGLEEENIYSLKDALPHLPLVTVKAGAEKIVKWGGSLYLSHLDNLPPGLEKGDRVRICSQEGQLLAVAVSLQEETHFCRDKIGFKYLRVLA